MLRSLLFVLTLLVAANVSALAHPPAAIMYINPQCSCCLGHADYLRQNGFKIAVKETQDMSQIRRQHGVPEKFEGCHIMAGATDAPTSVTFGTAIWGISPLARTPSTMRE
jgi:hypothetical protein